MQKSPMLMWTIMIIIVSLISKVLGLFRETAIAYQFGMSQLSDAYYISMFIPTVIFATFSNSIRDVFIPIYSNEKSDSKNVFLNTFSILLLVGSIVIFIFLEITTKYLVLLFAPGFTPELLDLTVQITRISLVSIIFMTISGLATAVLHSHDRFYVASIIGVPYNIVLILSIFFLFERGGLVAVMWGTVFAAVIQIIIQLPLLKKYIKSTKINLKDKEIKKAFKLLPPILLSSLGRQLKVMVDRLFASFLSEGSVSALNYANQIFQLPVSLIGMAITSVYFPSLSKSKNKLDEFRVVQSNGLKLIIIGSFPLFLILLLFSKEVVWILFERGEFSPSDRNLTAVVLSLFSISIISEIINQYFNHSFFALGDTKTPMKVTLIGVLINVILNVILVNWIGIYGIALATSVSSIISVIILIKKLRDKIRFIGWEYIKEIFYISITSFLVSLIIAYLYQSNHIIETGSQFGELRKIVIIGELLFVIFVSYFAPLFILTKVAKKKMLKRGK